MRYAPVVLTCAALWLATAASARAGAVVPYADNGAPLTALHYHLNEAPGATSVSDSSGNGLHLTTPSSPFTGGAGPSGLGTASGPISNPNLSPHLTGLSAAQVGGFNMQQFTIEAWVRNPTVASGGDAMGILQYRNGSDSRFELRLSNSNQLGLSYNRLDNGAFGVTNSAALTFLPDTWYHLAVTYDGDGVGNDSQIRFYQTPFGDETANLIGMFSAPDIKPLTGGGSLFLGSLEGNPGRVFGGLIDELRYTNAVLTPDQFNLTVPEPSTWFLVGIGALLIGARWRRPRR